MAKTRSMKLYRLKEEAKKYVATNDSVQEWGMWELCGVTMEALEEVEQRVQIVQLQCSDQKYVTEQMLFDREKLCNQALNGELMTLDQCINLYDEWLNTTTDLLLTDWIKQRKA